MTRLFAASTALAAVAFSLPAIAVADPMPGMAMPPSDPEDSRDVMPTMPGMADMPAMGSGSSRLPGDQAMHGLHRMAGGWALMVHGYAWGVYSRQGGPRGDDKAFAESMAMIEASRPLSGTTRLRLRTMLSLDPLMGDRGYPNLFATGETAGGKPLVDRQHPHDLFMELSGRIDTDLGGGLGAFVYAGLPGEPALGPSAFMHRASARLNPEAPITHHWFDSTHISFGVVTAGLASSRWQLEASAFNGREPDEDRWDIETPRLDSWSVRTSWQPAPRWLGSLSFGRLNGPERLHRHEDETRLIASVAYTDDRLAVTAGYARKHRIGGATLNAGFGEATFAITPRHAVFGRVERVANDELFPELASPLHDRRFTITKFTGGYGYTVPLSGPLAITFGGSASLYGKPDRLDSAYGRHPRSFTLFAKLALGG